MNITKEQAIEELKNRGIDISQLQTPTESDQDTGGSNWKSNVSKRDIYKTLKNRGVSDDEMSKKTGKPQSFFKSLLEEIPESGGALVGGILGAGLGGGTPASIPGAVFGAGLGGAAGKAYQQIGKQLAGEETVKTTTEAAEEIGMAGGRQMAYEAGGRILTGIAGKVLAPFKNKVTEGAKKVTQTLEKYMPKETSPFRIISKISGQKTPSLLPAEATESRVLDILENIAEGSLIGGKKISEYKNIQRPAAINNLVDDLVRSFGEKAEPDLIGDSFVMAVEGKLKPSRLAASTLYNTVDDMTKNLYISKPVTERVTTSILDSSGKPITTNVTKMVKTDIVDLSRLKEFVKPMAKTAGELQGIEAKNAGDDLVQAIMGLDNNVSFASAKELRSRLISKVDEFSIINKKAPAIGKAKKAIEILDSATGQALKEHNPDALQLWRQANKLYKDGSEQFNNEFIRRLIKQGVDKGNPEVIAKGIFKPGAVSNIRKARNAVDEKTWDGLKSYYVQDVVKKATSVEGEISGKAFINQLTGKTGMGEQALTEIFKPGELASLKEVGNVLQTATKKQAEGTGRMWIQLTQAGAVAGLMDERSRPYSVVLLGGPAVLSRLFTNPIAAKWLTRGVNLPARSAEAAAALTKLGMMSSEIQKNMEKEKPKEEE